MDKKTIRIALTKGRLEKDTVNLFDKIGYDVSQLRDKGRRLRLDITGSNIEVVLAKAADGLTYVEHGKDTIDEHGGRFFEVCDLGFGRCRFALAGKVGNNFYEGCGVKTIATKYPNITRRFFESKAMDVDIVKIEGSVELAPLLELSDGIVDIVETGTTLKENGLEVYEYVSPISARVIVNPVSMKLKKNSIEDLIDKMESNI